MDAKQLGQIKRSRVMEFIKERLTLGDGERLRFNMSGYEENTGECTVHNIDIVNRFADLGIYDYTKYLFLDFYKGSGTIYFQFFDNDESFSIDVYELGTREIIYEIFTITIFSNSTKRRRQ